MIVLEKAWADLAAHRTRTVSQHLRELFAADDKRFYMGLHDGLTPEGFDPWITPRAGPLQNQPDQ